MKCSIFPDSIRCYARLTRFRENFSLNPLKQNARSNFLFVIYKYFLKSKIV